jgi:hypothetical protein
LTVDEKLLRGVMNYTEISKYFVFPTWLVYSSRDWNRSTLTTHFT